MGQVMCSRACAQELWQQMLEGYPGYIPSDITIYQREFVDILTCVTKDYAEKYIRNVVACGVLPSRGEIERMRRDCQRSLAQGGKRYEAR